MCILYIRSELEFLKSLWGLGTGEEVGYRTGPPGYIGWRNSFLGIDSGAPYTLKNSGSVFSNLSQNKIPWTSSQLYSQTVAPSRQSEKLLCCHMTLPTNQLRCLAVTWPCPTNHARCPSVPCPMTLSIPNNNGPYCPFHWIVTLLFIHLAPPPPIVTSLVCLWRYFLCHPDLVTVQPLVLLFCRLWASLISRPAFTQSPPAVYYVPKGLLALSAPEVFYSLWGPWFTHCAVPGIYEAQARLSDWYIGLTHPATRSHRSSESPTNICRIHVLYMHILTRETTVLEMNVKMLKKQIRDFCQAKDFFFAKKCLTFRKKKIY